MLEITCAVSGAEETLSAIEAYGQVSSWLKVAGEAKAEVLADTIQRRLPSTTEGTLELGAFVGYSAIQFAKKIARAHMTGTSLEIDPVHVAVSRSEEGDRTNTNFTCGRLLMRVVTSVTSRRFIAVRCEHVLRVRLIASLSFVFPTR